MIEKALELLLDSQKAPFGHAKFWKKTTWEASVMDVWINKAPKTLSSSISRAILEDFASILGWFSLFVCFCLCILRFLVCRVARLVSYASSLCPTYLRFQNSRTGLCLLMASCLCLLLAALACSSCWRVWLVPFLAYASCPCFLLLPLVWAFFFC